MIYKPCNVCPQKWQCRKYKTLKWLLRAGNSFLGNQGNQVEITSMMISCSDFNEAYRRGRRVAVYLSWHEEGGFSESIHRVCGPVGPFENENGDLYKGTIIGWGRRDRKPTQARVRIFLDDRSGTEKPTIEVRPECIGFLDEPDVELCEWCLTPLSMERGPNFYCDNPDCKQRKEATDES